MNEIRNIGIIAHIDAGKTTTTERILYYTGSIKKIGEVHDGDTVTDWLPQERERGITIISAAVTCSWQNCDINIIDTPGHIDFSGEVDRALSVLDGVVIVLCAVSGVEPQTESVWLKSEAKNIPKFVYVNKMDRDGADFFAILNQISSTFESTFLPITIPLGEEKNFCGVIDLINQTAYYYPKTTEEREKIIQNYLVSYDPLFNHLSMSWETLEAVYGSKEVENAKYMFRPMLINTLASENITDTSSSDDIKAAIRKLCISNTIIPVMCGSSLKNKGVSLLLDSIVAFLPAPDELGNILAYDMKGDELTLARDKNANTSVLTFKMMNDKYIGALAACRIFSGKITKGTFLLNSSTGNKERISRIVRMQADKKFDIDEAFAGDIIGIAGLKTSFTGNTLCSENHPLVLEKISFAEPVVSAAIEPNTKDDYDKLPTVLRKMSYEDQTFKFKIDTETKETIISGMGALHLEIMVDRMKTEHDVNVIMKTPQVLYRESITKKVTKQEGKFIRQTGGRGQYGHVVIDLLPSSERLVFVNKIIQGKIAENYISSVEAALHEIVEKGIIASFPVFGVEVILHDGSQHPVDSSDIAFKKATEIAFKEAFLKAEPFLLEPIARVHVSTPSEYLGDVIGDVGSKRGIIEKTEERSGRTIVVALIPRSNLFNYASDLRSISSGRAFYTSIVSADYKPLPVHLMKDIIEERKR